MRIFQLMILPLLLIFMGLPLATTAAPRQEPTIVLDINKPELPPLIAGRAEAKIWQGTGATTYALRLTPGSEQEALDKMPTLFGQIMFYLVEGKMDVRFEQSTLNMIQGDIAMWGPLTHQLTCHSEQCLVFIMMVPED